MTTNQTSESKSNWRSLRRLGKRKKPSQRGRPTCISTTWKVVVVVVVVVVVSRSSEAWNVANESYDTQVLESLEDFGSCNRSCYGKTSCATRSRSVMLMLWLWYKEQDM